MKSKTVNDCTWGTNLLSYCPGVLTPTQTSQIKLTDDVSRFQPVANWQISLIVAYMILLAGISAKKAILAMC